MTGKALALTERDRSVIREVGRFGVVSRDQLVRLRLFSSKTRANERLKRLVGARYLTTRRQVLPVGGPRLVYLPGPETAETRESRKRFTEMSDLFLAHQLGVVDVRIAFEGHTQLRRWLPARDLGAMTAGLLPDAYFEWDADALTFCAFLEYDRGTETQARIEKKVRAYLDLAHSGRFEHIFKRRFFRVLVVTDTPGRLQTLSQTAARLTTKILRFTTLGDLSHRGPLSSIWRRPGESASESLTTS